MSREIQFCVFRKKLIISLAQNVVLFYKISRKVLYFQFPRWRLPVFCFVRGNCVEGFSLSGDSESLSLENSIDKSGHKLLLNNEQRPTLKRSISRCNTLTFSAVWQQNFRYRHILHTLRRYRFKRKTVGIAGEWSMFVCNYCMLKLGRCLGNYWTKIANVYKMQSIVSPFNSPSMVERSNKSVVTPRHLGGMHFSTGCLDWLIQCK